METLEEIQAQLKILNKKEEEVLHKMSVEVHCKYDFLVERNGKWYVNSEYKKAYCKMRDEELIPIQEQILELQKKNDELIYQELLDGTVEMYGCEIVGMLNPILNGKKLYKRILIKLHKA